MTPKEAVQHARQRLESARAKIDQTRIGARVTSRQELDAAAFAKRSVACPRIGALHPAAWVLNMNYSRVCGMIESGLFIYNPKGGSK